MTDLSGRRVWQVCPFTTTEQLQVIFCPTAAFDRQLNNCLSRAAVETVAVACGPCAYLVALVWMFLSCSSVRGLSCDELNWRVGSGTAESASMSSVSYEPLVNVWLTAGSVHHSFISICLSPLLPCTIRSLLVVNLLKFMLSTYTLRRAARAVNTVAALWVLPSVGIGRSVYCGFCTLFTVGVSGGAWQCASLTVFHW